MTAQRLLHRYGRSAVLYVPIDLGTFDPTSGDMINTFDEIDIILVQTPVDSNDAYAGAVKELQLTAFNSSIVWFVAADRINNDELLKIASSNGSYIKDTYRNQTLDILQISAVIERKKTKAIEAICTGKLNG
jgi:hypothetical protein